MSYAIKGIYGRGDGTWSGHLGERSTRAEALWEVARLWRERPYNRYGFIDPTRGGLFVDVVALLPELRALGLITDEEYMENTL